jgi:predicted TIM-barrel fold metal-dependent hydrolase
MFKVDLHAGCYPKPYLDELSRIGIGGAGGVGVEIPAWSSAEETIAEMDEQGIGVRVLHLSAPNVYFKDRGLSKALAVSTNDFIARIVNEHPDRFRGIASVPLGNLDDAYEELDRALGPLGMDGVLLGSNVDQVTLGDDRFFEFLAELDRRRTPVVLHPLKPIGQSLLPPEDVELAIPAHVGFLFETTRVMAELTFKGVFERLANLTFVLPHLGGTIPFLYPRWDGAYLTRSPGHPLRKLPERPSYYLKRHFYDTAVAYNPTPLRCTVEFVGTDHVVFGTDWPYTTRDGSHRLMIDAIERCGFSEMERERLFWRNAGTLLSKLSCALRRGG